MPAARALRGLACGRGAAGCATGALRSAAPVPALARAPPCGSARPAAAACGYPLVAASGARRIFGQAFDVGKIVVKVRDPRGTQCVRRVARVAPTGWVGRGGVGARGWGVMRPRGRSAIVQMRKTLQLVPGVLYGVNVSGAVMRSVLVGTPLVRARALVGACERVSCVRA